MKVITHDLGRDLSEIEIVPLADVHIGDPNCDYKTLIGILEYIKSHDNVFCILNGDLMNTAVKSSVSDVYTEDLNPMQALLKCVELFGDISNKILCVLGGNHEARIFRNDGIDTTRLMCQQLGITDNYSNTTAYLFVKFGTEHIDGKRGRKASQTYSLYCTHGTGGGRKEGGKINRLADLSGICDADIYVMSHTHLPAIFKENFFRVDMHGETVSQVEKTYVNTNAYLEYGGYGDTAGFKPASRSIPILKLSGSEKKVSVTL